MATKKKYPVIGGPIDGEYADYASFYKGTSYNEEGDFYEWRDQYVPFNSGRGHRRDPSMVWLFKDLLRPTIRA